MRLPSLNALRAFEAAARHESFARAAGELCVTEGAVSRHVKLLEQELGVTLFRRLTRKVELTPHGHQLLPTVSEAFATIAAGTARLTGARSDFRIASSQTLALRWLVPRLQRFRDRQPDIRLQLTSKSNNWQDFMADRNDIGIYCSVRGLPEELEARYFLPSQLTPVCAPRVLEAEALRGPQDLEKCTLLHSTGCRYDWQIWAKAFGLGSIDAARGETFPNLDMASQVAVLGEGVLLGDLTFNRREIDEGTLVAPFPDKVLKDDSEAYHVVARREAWRDPRVAAFYDWLIEERDGRE
jgi:LysR family glycine cleavage system transcriptional activator